MERFKRFVSWLFIEDKYPMKKECDCGQEDKWCTARFNIVGSGIFIQSSSSLIQCGKVKKQMQELREAMVDKEVTE